jgi:DNA-binding PadR family transcriptional regulator
MGLEKSREIARLKEKLGIEVLWVYILSLLKKAPSHAYVLRKEIHEQFGFRPGNVSVYVVLYKLEGRGFVSAKREDNRKVYSITEKGKKLFSLAGKEFSEREKILFD